MASKLAYGKKGSKPKIPPNADLIFDVHLVRVGVNWDDEDRADNMSDMISGCTQNTFCNNMRG